MGYYKQTSAAMLLRFNGAGACKRDCGFLRFNIAGAGKPQLLGYVIFYYVLDEGEIARIATSPQHRRQGVAVRLLEKMRAFSYEQNITRWLLDVRISNETAIHFYKAAGFAEDGVRKNFYANPPEDAILMSCEVETSGSDRA